MLTRQIGDRERWCLLCGEAYQAPSYTTPTGFCSDCWTPERRREQKRVFAAISRAKSAHLLATLTIVEWLAILDHFKWKCAYCGKKFDVLEHVHSAAQGGVTTRENVVPSCVWCNSRKDKPNLYPETAIPPEHIAWIKSELACIQHQPPIEPAIARNSTSNTLHNLGLVLNDAQNIKLRVREIAQQQGMGKSRLQRESGVSTLTLDHYWFREMKVASIHLPTLERLARALGIQVRDLFAVDDELAGAQKEEVTSES